MQYKDHTTREQRLSSSSKANIKDILALLVIGLIILLAMSNDFNQLIN